MPTETKTPACAVLAGIASSRAAATAVPARRVRSLRVMFIHNPHPESLRPCICHRLRDVPECFPVLGFVPFPGSQLVRHRKCPFCCGFCASVLQGRTSLTAARFRTTFRLRFTAKLPAQAPTRPYDAGAGVGVASGAGFGSCSRGESSGVGSVVVSSSPILNTGVPLGSFIRPSAR